MYEYLKTNWKKLAATTSRDSLELEESFMTQAQNFVQNKARPLFKDPYLLGFEIIHRPDESNTRMVGMYAFRVSGELFYVPVIFINGDIKGVESIYSEKEKLFYPLNAGWCEYIISKHEDDEGKATDEKDAKKKNIGINPDDVLNYNTRKMASIFAEMCDVASTATKQDKSDSLYKAAADRGPSVIEALVDMSEESDSFADAMATLTDFSRIESSVRNYTENLEKKASNKAVVKMRVGRFCKSAAVNNLKHGYSFDDNRPIEKVAAVTARSDIALRKAESGNLFEDVICTDKKIRTCLVLKRKLHISDSIYSDGYYEISSPAIEQGKEDCPVVLLSIEDKEYLKNVKSPAVIDDVIPEYKKERLRSVPDTGYTAIAILPNGDYVPLGTIKSVSTNENVITIKFNDNDYSSEKSVTLNTYLETSKTSSFGDILVFGNDVKFFSGKAPKQDKYSSSYDFPRSAYYPVDLNDRYLHEYLTEDESFKAIFDKSASLFNIVCGDTETGWCKRAYAAGQLVGAMHVSPYAAEEILNDAVQNGVFSGYVEKKAAQIRMNEPAFESPFYSQYFDAMVDPDTDIEVEGESDFDDSEPPETVQDTMKQKAIRNGTPQEIFDISIQIGSQQMFDAGALSGLAKTYDANYYMDQFTPDLLQALDKLARLIFLFYWKPEDMKESFGSDDMSQLESMLISTYKSYGDLVLELIQKNQSDKKL